MSGHSKWSTIKRKKGAIDAARSKVFQKLAKELYVAAKSGDPDPVNNAALRMVVEKAKAENMPKANIESAIQKAAAKGAGEDYESVRYEGYGPNGIAIMIDCLTDNKNRTAGFVRSTLSKRNGNLGTDGSVSYMFKRKGLIVLENAYEEEKVMEDILSLDILDMEIGEEDITIYTEPEKFLTVKDELDKLGYDKYLVSEVTFIPDNYIALDEEGTEKVMTLIEALEDLDDVGNVYHNLDILGVVMEDKLERLKRERDAIVAEIGEFDEEDFAKSGISLEEFSNPTEETIDALVKYIAEEYNQTSIYSE